MTFPGDPRAPADVRREQEEAAARQAEQAADGLGDKTKDELLVIVERREEAEGVDFGLKSNATKPEILKALRGTSPPPAQEADGEPAEG